MDIKEEAIVKHEEWGGKIEVISKAPLENAHDLSVAYTPGVAAPCLKIHENSDYAYSCTSVGNMVAVVSDGSAVLGLGNIGGIAGLPVMEGKSVLFKRFGGVNAFPIVLSTQDTEEIIATVKAIAPSFGGINLEDISAPRCFEIEKRLKEELDIPVFHDDQHGTAICVLAALINAAKLVGKKISDMKVCLSGPGAAGNAIIKLLIGYGVKDVYAVDRTGIIYKGREKLDFAKEELAEITNKEIRKGGLKEAMVGTDVFVGVSAPGCINGDMIKTMNAGAIVMAMANPTPEIMPDEAKEAGAKVVCTGRSDFANQVNNVLAFPGIFKGALECRASAITENMKLAAAHAIASLVTDEELNADYVIPSPLDPRVASTVAEAVKAQAIKDGLNRI
ncbi:MAG: NADP-dependent malic enzyme [Clostridia bacterium]|nr:NADP-dependent malic enzyme [Clostridia bacterium]